MSFIPGVIALAASQGCASSTSGSLTSFLPIIIVGAVFIIFMILPQRKKDKKVKDMLSSLKPGDRVRTIGGIYGTISSVKDDVVIIQVGPDKARLVFARGAISQVEEKGVENTMTEDIK